MNKANIILASLFAIGASFISLFLWNKRRLSNEKLNAIFPEEWRVILLQHVIFYSELSKPDKELFEQRIQRFLFAKIIEPVETDIDDTVRLLVASSAVIPTFAFPGYNYPNVRTILIYPKSFNEKYETAQKGYDGAPIIGMADSRFQNGTTIILSKPDLLNGFDGIAHKENVGIHEFIHLIDKADGEIDGIPEALMKHQFVGPWLNEIKSEMKRIERNKSDISPYALTNNAEFLAVVSEYFFDSPEKFHKKHPELYQMLSAIYSGKE